MLVSFLDQLVRGFVQEYVFSTFEIDAICFIDFLTKIWMDQFLEFWTFVLSFIFANPGSKFIFKLVQFVASI